MTVENHIFLIDKLSINGPFSIPMLVYQRVHIYAYYTWHLLTCEGEPLSMVVHFLPHEVSGTPAAWWNGTHRPYSSPTSCDVCPKKKPKINIPIVLTIEFAYFVALHDQHFIGISPPGYRRSLERKVTPDIPRHRSSSKQQRPCSNSP